MKKVAAYNELTVLRLTTGSLSVVRLQRAIRSILEKHRVLRTSLIFNSDGGSLIQSIIHNQRKFTFAAEQTFENDIELDAILYQIRTDPSLFDLSNGRVFHCQLLRQRLVNKCYDKEFLTVPDVLIIAFHHVACDRASREIFLNNLCVAYNYDKPLPIDSDAFQYTDYSIYERQMDMTASRDFWCSQLDGYDFKRYLPLPANRLRLPDEERSCLACFTNFSFDDNLSSSFLAYASSHDVTPFQLGLATFYAFLFKLSNNESDLCITCINANRYRAELRDVIGMFVATLPYRIQFDPNGSFDQLVKQVREQCLSILEHSHYPLQHIIGSHHSPAFLEIVFDFVTLGAGIDRLTLDGAQLEPVSSQREGNVAKFDMMLTLIYNPSASNDTMSCYLVCSLDLFEQATVAKLAQRFQHLLTQLFSPNSMTTTHIDRSVTPVSKLSIRLPEETEEMQRTIFHRLPNVIDTGMLIITLPHVPMTSDYR
jgi:hypothetical protein